MTPIMCALDLLLLFSHKVVSDSSATLCCGISQARILEWVMGWSDIVVSEMVPGTFRLILYFQFFV